MLNGDICNLENEDNKNIMNTYGIPLKAFCLYVYCFLLFLFFFVASCNVFRNEAAGEMYVKTVSVEQLILHPFN